MSAPLILAVAVVYTFVAYDQWRAGNPGMSVAWAGYAVANVGLAWCSK